MRPKKEVVVLVATVLLLSFLAWRRLSGGDAVRGGGGKRGEDVEFADYRAPDLGIVDPGSRDPLSWDRDPFSEPSDTRPLPPLALEPPPLPALAGLLPPGRPGPAPALFGRFLRADATPRAVPGLFVSEAEDDGGAGGWNGNGGVPADPTDPVDPDGDGWIGLGDEIDRLRSLGYADSPDDRDLTAEERTARIESWKRLYDWIRINEVELLFGQVRNDDRYGLSERLGDPIHFLEVDPNTGGERYPGQGPVPYERVRVLDWAFADTVANEIEIRRRRIGSSVTPGQFPEVMDFGMYCVDQRLEADRALAIAEDVFRMLSELFADDPLPRLGLARCYEAGFRLEEAYAEYLALLERFEHNADVHVMLGQLEARLRLFDSARERFEQAERIGRTSWLVQLGLGRFLYGQGHYDAALEHLELAHRFEPSAAYREARVRIRNELGAALVATGEVGRARDLFRQAQNADATNQTALAGLHAVGQLDAALAPEGLGIELERDRFQFELLVNLACESIARGELDTEGALAVQEALTTAAELDPVNASVAWRALSWLAEVTGYPEEALQYIDLAYEGDPTDPWTLYQRGRILLARDDPEGAGASFQSALQRELDFEDTLVGLGALAFARADHEAAELYFERALSIDPERSEVHGRRGLNLLALNRTDEARAAFEDALRSAPEDPIARAGLAWCAYRGGEPDLAIQSYADLDDLRRGLGEDDPYRLYARGQMERISDHLNKEIWSDRFERRFLRNGWYPDEMASPTIALTDGRLAFRGAFERSGQVRVFRTMAAPSFVSLEAVLEVGPENNARVGLFVAKERQVRGGGSQPVSEVRLARHREGAVQVKVLQSASEEQGYVDLGFPEWPTGRPVRIAIEREGEGSATTGRIVVDDFTVLEGAPLRNLFASTSDLRFGIFVEGEAGRDCDLAVDLVEVVQTIR